MPLKGFTPRKQTVPSLEVGGHETTKYLISFDDGAMTFSEEELPDMAEAVHAAVQVEP
jgi:hypothetical protein